MSSLRILFSDYNGSFEAFCEACYQAYLAFWASRPQLETKRIVRPSVMERGKEKVFWGIVDGHDDEKTFDGFERYEKIPCLAHMIGSIAQADPDTLYFRIRHKGKLRVHIFSKTDRYLIVLQERSQVFDFVTAHPLSARQLEKKVAQWNEAERTDGKIL